MRHRSVARLIFPLLLPAIAVACGWGCALASQQSVTTPDPIAAMAADPWDAVRMLPVWTRIRVTLVTGSTLEGALERAAPDGIALAPVASGNGSWLARDRISEVVRESRARGLRGGGRLAGRALGGLWGDFGEDTAGMTGNEPAALAVCLGLVTPFVVAGAFTVGAIGGASGWTLVYSHPTHAGRDPSIGSVAHEDIAAQPATSP